MKSMGVKGSEKCFLIFFVILCWENENVSTSLISNKIHVFFSSWKAVDNVFRNLNNHCVTKTWNNQALFVYIWYLWIELVVAVKSSELFFKKLSTTCKNNYRFPLKWVALTTLRELIPALIFIKYCSRKKSSLKEMKNYRDNEEGVETWCSAPSIKTFIK